MIDFLVLEETQNVLNEYRDETDLFRLRSALRKRFSDDECVAITQQIVLRQKGKNKFLFPDKMLFDREGYEQATHAAVAEYHAQFFSDSDTVLDICTGLGSDAVALSKKVERVITLDIQAERLALAAYNVSQLGNTERCTFVASSFELFESPRTVTALYADPSRRSSGKRRIEPEDYSPTVSEVLALAERLNISDGKCLIKLAPACDYDELLECGRIEVISLDGEVKEVLFFLDAERAGEVTAVVLHNDDFMPQRVCQIDASDEYYKKVSRPLTYVIEPDNAIIRAGVVNELAQQFKGFFLQAQTAYLTSDTKGDEKGYRAYAVLDHFDFNAKKVKKYLKDKNITALSIKKRGVNETADELQKRIGIKKGSNSLYLFVYRVGEKYKACLAERAIVAV